MKTGPHKIYLPVFELLPFSCTNDIFRAVQEDCSIHVIFFFFFDRISVNMMGLVLLRLLMIFTFGIQPSQSRRNVEQKTLKSKLSLCSNDPRLCVNASDFYLLHCFFLNLATIVKIQYFIAIIFLLSSLKSCYNYVGKLRKLQGRLVLFLYFYFVIFFLNFVLKLKQPNISFLFSKIYFLK